MTLPRFSGRQVSRLGSTARTVAHRAPERLEHVDEDVLWVSAPMHNHIGHFAAAGESICKALFFGGVTRRFPQLTFSFLEGGAAWGCSLLADLAGHWEKHGTSGYHYYVRHAPA